MSADQSLVSARLMLVVVSLVNVQFVQNFFRYSRERRTPMNFSSFSGSGVSSRRSVPDRP